MNLIIGILNLLLAIKLINYIIKLESKTHSTICFKNELSLNT